MTRKDHIIENLRNFMEPGSYGFLSVEEIEKLLLNAYRFVDPDGNELHLSANWDAEPLVLFEEKQPESTERLWERTR